MMSGNFRAVLTATAAAGIGVTTFTPRPLFEITVAAIVVIIALGWSPLLQLWNRAVPITVVLVMVGLVSVYLVRLTHAVAWLAPIVAGALIAIFVAQLFRRNRDGLVDQVAGQLTGVLIVVSGAGWLAVDPGQVGSALTLTAAVCLASPAIITALPVRSRIMVWASILAATAAGVGMGYGVAEITPLTGALVGLAAGLVVAAVHYLFEEYSDSDAALPSLAGAFIAVAVSGIPVYILGRVLLHMP
ncbi:MAG TPA: hypothetical protein VK054_06380 [Beutenbergiaceae bacterium]|nr:hypothetical protein [Beutenbergiaceae bacterium]